MFERALMFLMMSCQLFIVFFKPCSYLTNSRLEADN